MGNCWHKWTHHPKRIIIKKYVLYSKKTLSPPLISLHIGVASPIISTFKKTWVLPNKFLTTNKVKEVSYKIIHRYYPANHYMQKLKKYINTNCSFCDSHPETVNLLFWLCPYTKKLWADLSRFTIDYLTKDFVLHFENVVFGFHNFSKREGKCYFLINLFLFLAKMFIHKSKCIKKIPSFVIF